MNASKYVMIPNPNKRATIRLFCFPHAGGSPSVFYDWSKLLPAFAELCIIQLPGHGSRLMETAFTRINALSEDLFPALESFTDCPFVCFGHSMGGLVAFEWIRSLRKRNRKLPRTLISSSCLAPQVRKKGEPLHELSDRDLIEKLKIVGGTPLEILENEDLMNLVLPGFRADLELLFFYEYVTESPLDVPIFAVGGEADKSVSSEDLEKWSSQTRCSFSTKLLPGGHFYFQEEPKTLLENVCEILENLIPNNEI